eukprot:GHVT01066731.1.p1 GENE.GHVT01066731.1~~GHVT01066731.1.p1  ORF type:complete len:196 (-),score=41.35 GHVT01066731.1:805-1392(-)
MSRYASIVQLKTAWYSFYLPCALGLILAGKEEPSLFVALRSVCVALGTYFQVQDDFLDCFAPPGVLGKAGTDIEDHKCTWLLVKALGMNPSSPLSPDSSSSAPCCHSSTSSTSCSCLSCSHSTLLSLNNVPSSRLDASTVAKWKKVYADMNLPKAYKNFEKTAHAQISRSIAAVESPGVAHVCAWLLEKIHGRPC